MNRHQELHDINHYCDDNPHLYFQGILGEREGESDYGSDLGGGEMTTGWEWSWG